MGAYPKRVIKYFERLDLNILNTYIICMWHFTKHAQERMLERGYSQEEVLMVLDGEVPSIIYPSPKENTVDLYFGKIGEKFIMIPVDRTTQSIITIRAMRKGEKNQYMKEVKNECAREAGINKLDNPA